MVKFTFATNTTTEITRANDIRRPAGIAVDENEIYAAYPYENSIRRIGIAEGGISATAAVNKNTPGTNSSGQSCSTFYCFAQATVASSQTTLANSLLARDKFFRLVRVAESPA